jgi:integrase
MRTGEARQITWAMYDRDAQTLTLDPKASKTRRGRVIAIAGPLSEIIERRLQRRRLDKPLVFHRTAKGKPGEPIRDFMPAWRAALAAAMLPTGLRPHDLRRSALRNLVRAGVDVTVAMRISGHRTRATFDRYNIVSGEDVKDALTRTAAYVATLPAERNIERAQNAHNPEAGKRGSNGRKGTKVGSSGRIRTEDEGPTPDDSDLLDPRYNAT